MLVEKISLREIIERKIDYIERDERYQSIELKNVGKGELNAYCEIIYDIENMNEQEFVHKYVEIFKKSESSFKKEREQGCCNNITIEQLTGYKDAIEFVLILLNPQLEFENGL